MNKKNLILIFFVVIALVILEVLVYRFASWTEQSLGEVFSYIIMFSMFIFILSPFKFIKDNAKNISLLNYVRYLIASLFKILKFLIFVIKESIVVLFFILSRLFKKKPVSE